MFLRKEKQPKLITINTNNQSSKAKQPSQKTTLAGCFIGLHCLSLAEQLPKSNRTKLLSKLADTDCRGHYQIQISSTNILVFFVCLLSFLTAKQHKLLWPCQVAVLCQQAFFFIFKWTIFMVLIFFCCSNLIWS